MPRGELPVVLRVRIESIDADGGTIEVTDT